MYIELFEDGTIKACSEKYFINSVEVDYEVVRGCDGKLYKSGEEPPESPPTIDYAVEAQAALDRTDLVALRCFKNGVVFPPEWVTYCATLRNIINTGEGPLPERPEYPEGS